MIRWTVLLSACLSVISATLDYVYEEHSFMGEISDPLMLFMILTSKESCFGRIE